MKIKKFIAGTIQEAVKQVKEEMGPNAVILSTKSVVNGHGLKGVFTRPLMEITAAVDDSDWLKARKMEGQMYGAARSQKRGIRDMDSQGSVHEEIIELKKMVHGLSLDVKQVKVGAATHLSGFQQTVCPPLSDTLTRLYTTMLTQGVPEEFALQSIQEVSHQIGGEGEGVFEKQKIMLMNALEKVIKVSGTIKPKEKVVAFVGPTGVGKTTTIAKLASFFSIKKQMNIGLVTVDTYRIAAVEQLKVYAQLLGIPLAVVHSKDELKAALELYGEKDMVFIDTAGRNHKDTVHMDELSAFFDIDIPISKYLMVSVVTGSAAMMETIGTFMKLSPESILFSKIYEGVSFGHIVKSALRFNVPVSYLTTGQKVPDDIELATSRRIVELMFDPQSSFFDDRETNKRSLIAKKGVRGYGSGRKLAKHSWAE